MARWLAGWIVASFLLLVAGRGVAATPTGHKKGVVLVVAGVVVWLSGCHDSVWRTALTDCN